MIDARHFFDDIETTACCHQYELVYHDKIENIKIYQCYWCLNQLIKFGGVADRSNMIDEQPGRSGKNLTQKGSR